MPFMNKTLSMDIMTRTRLRNKFLNDWSEGNKNKFLKERILVFHFWKSDYFENKKNLHGKNINDNKTFRKTIIRQSKTNKKHDINRYLIEEIIVGD